MTIENSSHCVQEMRRSCGLGLEGVRGRWMTMPRHAEASESHPGRWRSPGSFINYHTTEPCCFQL